MSRHIEVFADGFSYLDSPRWYDGRLWVSDFYTPAVLAVDTDGSIEHVAEVAAQPSGLGWLPDGRLLIVSMRDHRILRREPSGDLVTHADLAPLDPSGHLNDMVVTPFGRAYVGEFGFDLMGGDPIRTTRIYCVEPDGEASVVANDMLFPNGMVLLTDSTLLVAETFGDRITAFDSGTDGSLYNRREWIRFGQPPATDDVGVHLRNANVAPDGMCADIDGSIWVADGAHNRVLHVYRSGDVLEEISTGELGVYACMLGGHDGRTLFMCAAPSFYEHERAHAREGLLLTTRVEVPHGALP
ncbi:MAG TPA: SMP-30/gluconolactonase/LRE family protein [Nocardioidaceae bacterium]|nr:SMP-30/gluconolactonase/LRE family protein [Nocardioidaceae bacterium]